MTTFFIRFVVTSHGVSEVCYSNADNFATKQFSHSYITSLHIFVPRVPFWLTYFSCLCVIVPWVSCFPCIPLFALHSQPYVSPVLKIASLIEKQKQLSRGVS